MTNRNKKLAILFIITFLLTLITCFIKPVAQPSSYHHFADQQELLDIPNFFNVISNIPFIIIGGIGLFKLQGLSFSLRSYIIPTVLFGGIILTGIGSSWYHLNPNNATLVWDRLPMTIVFMSFLSLVIYDLVSERAGKIMFLPLLVFGVFSVIYWQYTELKGRGDLRPYGLVQFYPVIMIPLIMILFAKPNSKLTIGNLSIIVFFYVLAKIFEYMDSYFYNHIHLSGHTLKHLAAAMSCYYIMNLFNPLNAQKKPKL